MFDPSAQAASPAIRDYLLLTPVEDLTAEADALSREGHGSVLTYSPKVFIPLTQLCRNVCHYCTFAHPPRKGDPCYLSIDEVLSIAEAGRKAGCLEALFTIGDKPELRYSAAKAELSRMGFETTAQYLEQACGAVLKSTGLLPHVNAGVLSRDEMARLRHVSASQGLMLESTSDRLSVKGGPHHGSADKVPAARLKVIAAAGELAIPFTTGLLIGIGETREERLDALVALKALHQRWGHIQEIIIQNFRAKAGTRMADAAEPPLDELLWTIAAARMIFGPHMSIQAPPNLSPGELRALATAGINDWGGVSPVTADHVNPEAPWPDRDLLREETAAVGKNLVERLTVYPGFVAKQDKWIDPAVVPHVLKLSDSVGFGRTDRWRAGNPGAFDFLEPKGREVTASGEVRDIVHAASQGEDVGEDAIARLLKARGADFWHVLAEADALRRRVSGDSVSYVINRNINYTNVCQYRCTFCAFSKGRGRRSLRGAAYDLDLEEVARRVREAHERGATEVCMQGGIHPAYTGETYLELLRTAKEAAPDIHVHAFSPLEVAHGASTLGISVSEFLRQLRQAGLGSLPGTAAEVLDDRVRSLLCPDKLSSREWLHVIGAAHDVGLRTTATIMFGHVDGPEHWAKHLSEIRNLQRRTGGFTEFVPLPFVHAEAPLYLAGRARQGPTTREVLLMHAVSRLALNPFIKNIQVSWVKLGAEGVKMALNAGANDLGGTLMNESISAAAGASHGQELPAAEMEALIRLIGRKPLLRTTLYEPAPEVKRLRALRAEPLRPIDLTPARRPRPAASKITLGQSAVGSSGC